MPLRNCSAAYFEHVYSGNLPGILVMGAALLAPDGLNLRRSNSPPGTGGELLLLLLQFIS